MLAAGKDCVLVVEQTKDCVLHKEIALSDCVLHKQQAADCVLHKTVEADCVLHKADADCVLHKADADCVLHKADADCVRAPRGSKVRIANSATAPIHNFFIEFSMNLHLFFVRPDERHSTLSEQ